MPRTTPTSPGCRCRVPSSRDSWAGPSTTMSIALDVPGRQGHPGVAVGRRRDGLRPLPLRQPRDHDLRERRSGRVLDGSHEQRVDHLPHGLGWDVLHRPERRNRRRGQLPSDGEGRRRHDSTEREPPHGRQRSGHARNRRSRSASSPPTTCRASTTCSSASTATAGRTGVRTRRSRSGAFRRSTVNASCSPGSGIGPATCRPRHRRRSRSTPRVRRWSPGYRDPALR